MIILVDLQYVYGVSSPILKYMTLTLGLESRVSQGYSWCWHFLGWARDGDVQSFTEGTPRCEENTETRSQKLQPPNLGLVLALG